MVVGDRLPAPGLGVEDHNRVPWRVDGPQFRDRFEGPAPSDRHDDDEHHSYGDLQDESCEHQRHERPDRQDRGKDKQQDPGGPTSPETLHNRHHGDDEPTGGQEALREALNSGHHQQDRQSGHAEQADDRAQAATGHRPTSPVRRVQPLSSTVNSSSGSVRTVRLGS